MKTRNTKFILKFSIVGLCLIVFGSCQNASCKEDVAMENVSLTEDYKALDESGVNGVGAKTQIELKIIKSAFALYKVKGVKRATELLEMMAQKYHGYLSDLRFENNLYEKRNRFASKVPNSQFDSLLNRIASVAIFTEFENITTQDVTEAYVDVEGCLATELEVKQRHIEILWKNARIV